ncbi:MAG: orotate phosphoribosyltransferase [Phycisphaerales bacterium]
MHATHDEAKPGDRADARPSRGELATRIAEACLLRGSFTLRSGRTSSYYLDKYRFSTRPEVLGPVASLIAERIALVEREIGRRAERLAGAELGGVPLVTAAALETGRPCIFVRNARKDYGTSKQIEGLLDEGDAVILLEDVATTGGQALEACESIRLAGGEVLAVVAAIDREEGARENVERAGLRFESIFTKTDLGVTE